MTKNIAVVYGGESCEHDISIITAISVYNIIKWDYNAILVYMRSGKFYVGDDLSKISLYKNVTKMKLYEVFFQNGMILKKKRCGFQMQQIDCALICNHGGTGENGALAGFFEVSNIPYTSSGIVESGICMDKTMTKKALDYYGFPYLPYTVIKKNYDLSELDSLIEFPYIIKPASLGSSVGISVVNNKHELIEGIKLGLMFCENVIIEKALKGFDEFNCAGISVNKKVLLSEIERPVFKDSYLNFYEKYVSPTPKRELPAKIDKNLRQQIENMTKALYVQLNLSGIVRIDYLFCENILYVNEINTVPGSLAVYLFKAKGMESIDIFNILIDEAIMNFENKKMYTTSFDSSVLENFDSIQLKGGIKK